MHVVLPAVLCRARRRWTAILTPAVLSVALTTTLGAADAVAPTTTEVVRVAAAGQRPNIVLISADDMAATDLAYMPKTRRLLGSKGAEFTDFLAPHPICCPARAQLLTGQHAQNNGVHHNEGQYGGYPALRQRNNTVARWLSDAGYRTGFVGKFLNGWSTRYGAPAGWDSFDALYDDVYDPYGYTAYRDGRPKKFPEIHTSDYVTGATVKYIERFSRGSEPFFIWASQVAPHKMKIDAGEMGSPVPADRHKDLFPDAVAPSVSSPSFNETDADDKPPYVRNAPPVDPVEVNGWFRQRIRSLQSVDEGVAAVVSALKRTGELPNTIIAFTSDNGYMMGEHRLTMKNYPYEESLRIPLLVRGPGYPAGKSFSGAASLIDLAPTFVKAARTTAGRVMDGQPLSKAMAGRSDGSVLIQAGGPSNPWWWRGVRTSRYTYVTYVADGVSDGVVELYDREEDPWQLTNLAGRPEHAAVEAELKAELSRLEDCAGSSCR